MIPDKAELQKYLLRLQICRDIREGDFQSSGEEVRGYICRAIDRLALTLEFIAQLSEGRTGLKVLEIGSSAFFLTAPLVEFLGHEVIGVDEPGLPPGASYEIENHLAAFRSPFSGRSFTVSLWEFNAEKDPFPFAEGEFDLVLCNEVIEHLVFSPSHMLAEIHRVLKRSGRLLLSTPNALHIKYLAAQLLNKNLSPPYSPHGIYGRHNRLFTAGELYDLLSGSNFRVLEFKAVNFAHSDSPAFEKVAFKLFNLATALPLPYLAAKREHLFFLAEAVGRPRFYQPGWLYLEADGG